MLDAKGGDCEVFNSDTRLAFQDKKKYVYPDAMVVCGEIEESENENYGITNPKVIVEVLSKSTEGYDKDGKFLLYMLVPSLEYYVLIEQEEPKIHLYTNIQKQNGNSDSTKSLWQIETLIGIDKMLVFPSLELEIPFADIYRKVKFENV